MHFCARCSILSYTRCNSAVSILRIDTAELHLDVDLRDGGPVFRAPLCIIFIIYETQGDVFHHYYRCTGSYIPNCTEVSSTFFLYFSFRASQVYYTGCRRRKGPNFGRVFLMLNYTDITQNTYIQS